MPHMHVHVILEVHTVSRFVSYIYVLSELFATIFKEREMKHEVITQLINTIKTIFPKKKNHNNEYN